MPGNESCPAAELREHARSGAPRPKPMRFRPRPGARRAPAVGRPGDGPVGVWCPRFPAFGFVKPKVRPKGVRAASALLYPLKFAKVGLETYRGASRLPRCARWRHPAWDRPGCRAGRAKREIVGADEENVDAGRGGDLIDAFDGTRLFNNDDDHHICVGGIVIAGFAGGPGGAREHGARTAPPGWRIAASGGGLRGEFGRAGEREHHAADARIEHALGGPDFVHRDARKGERGQAAGGQHDVAQRFEGNGRMLHLDPQKIEAERGGVRGDVGVGDRDGGCDDRQTFAQTFLDGVFPGCIHFLINQTSATWQPRPLPPRPASRYHERFNSPLDVAARGMSNSMGRTGWGLSMSGWISISKGGGFWRTRAGLEARPTSRILRPGLSPA